MNAITTKNERRINSNPEPRLASNCSIHSKHNRVAPLPSSDDDGMCLLVERYLQTSNYAPVRAVRCSVFEGVVTLFGTLPSFYMKQIAQTLVCCVESVIRVDNRCVVEYQQQQDSTLNPSVRSPSGGEKAPPSNSSR